MRWDMRSGEVWPNELHGIFQIPHQWIILSLGDLLGTALISLFKAGRGYFRKPTKKNPLFLFLRLLLLLLDYICVVWVSRWSQIKKGNSTLKMGISLSYLQNKALLSYCRLEWGPSNIGHKIFRKMVFQRNINGNFKIRISPSCS